ncbi:TetR/AcrR family transcriptional regulator [Alicyclobacillus sp. SP_1]|uniref:TetR/AcrR family transcriptional regulator n=1 Tax=Alicyclobacillus sp. SP_1 TaxID=2942475 RepID=UPI00215730F3|nr:TetR/AcrR family transcriptional regulator [Alicyclobacillus sp. SP_1]
MNDYSFIVGGRAIAKERDDAKHVAILRAAVEVMSQYGYHGAQISRIARAAGVADGTVYLYFKNKEDILVSILRMAIGRVVQECSRQLAACQTTDDKLAALIRVYFADLGDNPALAMVTQVYLRQVDANIRREIGDIMKPFYSVVDELIVAGMQEGKFRSKMDRRIARRMIFGTMDETVTAWVLTGSKYSLVSQVDDVVDVLLHGLVAVNAEENAMSEGSLSHEDSSTHETDV